MMIKLDRKHAQTLARISQDKDFIDFLLDCREERRDTAENAQDDRPMYRAQGASIWIKELVRTIEGARDTLEKMR